MALLLLLAACDDGETEPTPTASPTAAGTATGEATATPRATATSTATPEPPQPEVSAVQQTVGDEGEVIISSVYAPQPAWLVLYADDEGEPGEVLGHAALEEGENRDVSLSVDPYRVTATLHAVLHQDEGELETFEFPGADEPLEVDGERVSASFDVDIQVTMPQIVVSDQELSSDGQVVVDSVTAAEPGWVALQADEEGEPGPVLGQTPVEAGENENVVVRFNWRDATRQMHVVLYNDAGRPGRFDLGGDDRPVVVNGEPIRAAFTAGLPPDVTIISQPLTTGEVVIDRILINSDGWVSVYSNFDGFIDRRLGVTPLEAGVHRNVRVAIDTRNATDTLHVMLHEDTGVAGTFEYPADDPAYRNEAGQPLLFSFETQEGNYVMTEDQALGEDDTVQIPLVVTDLATWVAVWNDADGAPDEVIGQTLVSPGVHRGVRVEIEAGEATDTLHVILHQDAGVPERFEYPDGPDEILQSQGSAIRAPFMLRSE